MIRILTFLFIQSVIVSCHKRYDNYKLIQVTPKNEAALAAIAALPTYGFKVDFWKPPTKVGKAIDILISEDTLQPLARFLKGYELTMKLAVKNIQKLLDREVQDLMSVVPFRAGASSASFQLNQYHSQQDINSWLDSLAQDYSSIASTFVMGQSKEGRDLKIIKIGAPGSNKKAFWLDAGIHAREWVAPATAVYIINELVTKYSSNSQYKQLVDGLDFYILPVVNPDGYEYSRDSDRMWRKTRGGPYCSNSWWGKQCCYGADPNRNWDFHWMASGTSKDPCDETYGGPEAFSEIECKQMSNWLWNNRQILNAYISLHSYSDLFMYGYGYAAKTYPPDVADLKALANQAVKDIAAVHGGRPNYDVGSPTDILYAASGASDDWAKGVAGIKWTYTLELRPGPTDPDNDNSYGFLLPASYIIPTAQEAWAGIIDVAVKALST